MPEMCESCEVKASFVHLLHKRRFGVDDSGRLKDAVNFLHAAVRIKHVLQHCLNDYTIEYAVFEREVVSVADEPRSGSHDDVSFNDSCAGGIFKQHFHPCTQSLAANDQQQRLRRKAVEESA